MPKRAQLSYFIIVGIVLLIVAYVIGTASYNKKGPSKLFGTDDQVVPFLESALALTAEEGIVFISGQSGFYEVTEPALRHGRDEKVAYYFYNNSEMTPTPDILEDSLEDYIEEHLAGNLHNFSDIGGYEIKGMSLPKNTVEILENEVLIHLEYPLEVVQGGKTTKYQTFEIELPISLRKFIVLSQELISESHLEKNEICITCIDELARKYDLQVDMYDIGDPNLLFTISDNNTRFDGKPLAFSFAIQLSESKGQNKDIFAILPIEDQEVFIGYPFNYQVNASAMATFYDNSPLFRINKERGTISFVPEEKDQGSHLIKIDAIDGDGQKASQLFSMTIKGFSNSIQIEPITQLIAESKKKFSHTVKVTTSGDSLIYKDNSSLFDISQSGEILFVPIPEQRGSYDITVAVFDKSGSKSSEEFNLVII